MLRGHRPLNGINVSDSSRLALWWAVNWKKIQYSLNTKNFIHNEYRRNQYEFVNDFEFAGLEFGRYVNEGERETRFAGLAEACKLLSSPLFFESTNLGMDKHLLIGIGARGAGGKALAHFEASYNNERLMFINTTKDGGNHSFAHEYLHALDFFLGSRVDVSERGAWLSDYNNGTPLRRVVAEIIDACKKQMKIEKYGEYWHRPKEILARSFETWVAFVLSQSENKEYQNSFLCKPFSYYQKFPVYPHHFSQDLDDKFILFCQLVGQALRGESISRGIKKVASKSNSISSKSKKSTYLLKDYAKIDKLLNDEGLKVVETLTIKNGKIVDSVATIQKVAEAESHIKKCSSALLKKLAKDWHEKRTKSKRDTKEDFVQKSNYVIREFIRLMLKHS